jgi:hypothetical protein
MARRIHASVCITTVGSDREKRSCAVDTHLKVSPKRSLMIADHTNEKLTETASRDWISNRYEARMISLNSRT